MIEVSGGLRPLLRPVLEAERPGPDAVAGHVVGTGLGRVWVDRLPEPDVIVVAVHDNVLVRGAVSAAAEAGVAGLAHGWVDAPAGFEPLLRAASDRYVAWQRVILALDGPVPTEPPPPGTGVRRLDRVDSDAVAALDPDLAWISKTWGGAGGLAASGMGWGTFAGGRLVAVACTFFQGWRHEDVGVVTEPAFRGRGFATAAAAGLCRDIQARGRRPSWTTWAENQASRRTARRLGFRHDRDTLVYLVGIDPPS